MNRLVKLILAIIMGALGVLFLNKEYQFLSYDIPYFSVPYGQVRVDIVNKAEETIKIATIKGKAIELLEAGNRQTILFDASGEGSYQMEVIFASGKKLKGAEVYIEAGYFIKEVVQADTIHTFY